MRTTVNPGAQLVLEGSFEVDEAFGMVTDRESLEPVSLYTLLRMFLEDPSDHVTGPIRITIEPDLRMFQPRKTCSW